MPKPVDFFNEELVLWYNSLIFEELVLFGKSSS